MGAEVTILTAVQNDSFRSNFKKMRAALRGQNG